ncbi:MAG: hypothetical protein IT236_17885, partial [Bacteroidia bacterium]|nr:hypothetical protein [Bacteroidia bacterium]
MKTIIFKSIHRLQITFGLFVIVFSSNAQFFNSIDTTNSVKYGARDGSGNQYYIGGDMIVKTSSTNQTILWSKKLNVSLLFGVDIIGVDAGNNLLSTNLDVTGLHTRTTVRKISPAGSLLWSRRLYANTNIMLRAHLVSKDNSIYLGGGDCAFQNGLIKLNSSGNIVWAKAYEDFNLRGFIAAIKEKKNGNLLVAAQDIDASSCVISLFELDTAGTLLWNKFYKLSGIYNGSFGDVAMNLTSKNEIIFSMNPFIGTATISPLMFKTDSSGTLNWSRRYSLGGSVSTNMVSMQIDQNDNVVSASSYNASFGLVRFSSLTGLPLNASASDSICFNKISILNANSII